jgi:hypothetical protein
VGDCGLKNEYCKAHHLKRGLGLLGNFELSKAIFLSGFVVAVNREKDEL